MPVENVREKIFVDGAGAPSRPKLQQVLQALLAVLGMKRGFVSWQSDQAKRIDPRQNTVFGRLQPDRGTGDLGLGCQVIFDQFCRPSGKRLFRQKILHRLPEEDWRMKFHRFVAG